MKKRRQIFNFTVSEFFNGEEEKLDKVYNDRDVAYDDIVTMLRNSGILKSTKLKFDTRNDYWKVTFGNEKNHYFIIRAE